MGFTSFQKLLLLSLLGAVVIFFSFLFKELLLTVFLTFVLAYLLLPIVDRVEFIFKSRLLSIFILYILFFMGFGFIFVVVVPIISNELTSFSYQVPGYLVKLKSMIFQFQESLSEKVPLIKQYNIFQNIQVDTQTIVFDFAKGIPEFILSILSVLSYLVLVPIILFFFLLQGSDMERGLLKLIPNAYFELIAILKYKVGSQLGNYLRGILLEIIIMSSLSSVLFVFVGADYAFILGAIIGITNIIPYVGPLVGAIPVMLIIYMQMKVVAALVPILIVLGIVQLVDNILLKPIIYSYSVDLHPLSVLFAVLIGGILGGIWGIIFGVPIAGILKVVITHVYREVEFRMTYSSRF